MRVLIICYCYPPDPGPRAYRWSAIAEFWAQAGYEVHVVSARKDRAPARETLNGVEVYRVGGVFTENLRILIERRRRTDDTTLGVDRQVHLGATGFSGWADWLKRLHDLTWQKIYWPESTCLWYFPAAKKALELVRSLGFGNLISVSTPYTGHLVGAQVKQAVPDLYWLADIGDPLSFGEPPFNNQTLYKKLNQRSERALVAAADAVSVTVSSCAEEFRSRFPESGSKIVVIPPLYSAKPGPPHVAAPSDGKVRLVFAGSLYRSIRNPSYLLSIIDFLRKRMEGLEFHVYGRLNDCSEVFLPYEHLLGKHLFVHGQVPRDEATAAINNASALIISRP